MNIWLEDDLTIAEENGVPIPDIFSTKNSWSLRKQDLIYLKRRDWDFVKASLLVDMNEDFDNVMNYYLSIGENKEFNDWLIAKRNKQTTDSFNVYYDKQQTIFSNTYKWVNDNIWIKYIKNTLLYQHI